MNQVYPCFFFVILLFGACAQPGVEYKPTFRLAGVIADSIDTEISSLGYGVSGETDYSSVEIGIGSTKYVDGERKGLSELIIAKSSFDDLDAVEISGGGRFYFGAEGKFSPFGSLYLTNTISDFVPGTSVELGTQIGIQLGLGGEYRINDHLFIDTSLRYLVPIKAGESNTFPTVETEFNGFSIVLGLGVEL